ncbi:hypothetical protein [Streptomyces profundus]|uniref:DUF7848 domain-containing protein n=1 Tax=Streptomyces profundus TaxID=2867410 RepID=UPI001D16C65C|nr:hypothetical protein [Streptomyces sp. MA3_2.13]UED86568.1 hypothetical protein K4G22_22215 [Streptomyces sp. MA3_2.13]
MNWLLAPVRAEGAPKGIFGGECVTCGEQSPLVDDDPQPVAIWAIRHTQREPSHGLFLFRAEKHWRVERCAAANAAADAAGGRHPVAEFFDRAFGPAFVGLMCLLTAFAGYLIGYT